MPREIWRKLTHVAGEYEVSDRGRIRRILNGSTTNQGYHQVAIKHRCDPSKRRSTRVHRLVAQYFLNDGLPLPPGAVVDHINGDRSDNRVENLRITTQTENCRNTPQIREFLRNDIIAELQACGRLLPEPDAVSVISS